MAIRKPAHSRTVWMPMMRTQEFNDIELNGLRAEDCGFHRLGQGGRAALEEHTSKWIDLCERTTPTSATLMDCIGSHSIREDLAISGPATIRANGFDLILMRRGMQEVSSLSEAYGWHRREGRTLNRVEIWSNLDGGSVHTGSMGCGPLWDPMAWKGAWVRLIDGINHRVHSYEHLSSRSRVRGTKALCTPKGADSQFIHQSSIFDP